MKFITIAVDFDGTLCEHAFPDIGKPNLTLIAWLKELREKGTAKIILWTCRMGKELAEAIEWCKIYNLEFDAINDNIYLPEGYGNRKIVANIYIDDKAMTPEGFIESCKKEDKDVR